MRARHGLTYRELSEESGIPIPTLAWWSRKLEQEAESAVAERCELVAVEVVDDELDEKAAEAIEIVIGDRLRLVVPSTASEAQVRRILRAVGSC